MNTLPSTQESLWLPDKTQSTYPSLQDDITVDVAIVGGGIAGVTTAYVLSQAGLKVAVVEKNTIASGTTGGTTGKVTSQHGLIYSELLERFGRAKTQLYADAYQSALTAMAAVIKTEKINCSWQREDNFVYTTDPKRIASFQQEAKDAASLGLPASFETKLPLPFKVKGAVKFTDQARFDAVAYTRELATRVIQKGGHIFEHSNVKHIRDGNPCKVVTDHGSVTAQHIVLATKVPPGPQAARLTYAIVEYPETSYIVAGKPKTMFPGMYITPDKDHYSLLPLPEKNILLVGGENHIPGLGIPEKHQQKLADYAQHWFGIDTTQYRWKAMDYIAYDKLLLVGKLYPFSKNTYMIGGFKKWGLSSSWVAATVIRDLVQGETFPLTQLFYPHRVSAPKAIPSDIKNYLQS